MSSAVDREFGLRSNNLFRYPSKDGFVDHLKIKTHTTHSGLGPPPVCRVPVNCTGFPALSEHCLWGGKRSSLGTFQKGKVAALNKKNFHLVLEGLRGQYLLVALTGHIPQPITAILTEMDCYFLSPLQKTCECLQEYSAYLKVQHVCLMAFLAKALTVN
jgi:hypothetical protein